MLDVLEHMYDPMGSITQCARLLKPGGLLVVKSPNGAMQLRKERLKKKLGREDGYVAAVGHLNQFTPQTLSSGFPQVRPQNDHGPQHKVFSKESSWRLHSKRVARHAGVLVANTLMQVTGTGLEPGWRRPQERVRGFFRAILMVEFNAMPANSIAETYVEKFLAVWQDLKPPSPARVRIVFFAGSALILRCYRVYLVRSPPECTDTTSS